MLHSVIDFSEEPLFPFETLSSAKPKLLKKQSEDGYVSTRFIEFLIAKFYPLEVPFAIRLVEEVMIHSYKVLSINNEFLLFIKEYVGNRIDLQFTREVKGEIDKQAGLNNVKPVCVFISYENALINCASWLVRRTGCYLLDRKELSDFVYQYNLSNKHWVILQNKLQELENCTNSENNHERKAYRQAAEGFFMRVSELINGKDALRSDWYYSKNNTLTLEFSYSKDQHTYFILITNTGVFKMFVTTTSNIECVEDFTFLKEYFIKNVDLKNDYSFKQLVYNVSKDNNYLFEVEGMDWYKSEREISVKLVELLKSIHMT